MTDTILIPWLQLGSRLTEFGHQENRIVTESVGAAWFVRNYTLNRSLHYTSITRRLGQRNDAAKTGTTLLERQPFQSLQDQTKTFLIGCIPARKTSGKYARGSSQGIYFQTRIVCQGKQARSLGIGTGLQLCIFRKRAAGFLHIHM